MILVVGSTGQLGTEVVGKLVAAGQPVRAFVRKSSQYEHLASKGIEIVFGDLKDAKSVELACEGVKTVISTATVVFPRGAYSFKKDEYQGYQNLIRACLFQNVDQLIYISNIAPDHHEYKSRVPTLRLKREIEQMIRESGVPYTIFRSAPFMDDYFVLMGSDIPLRNAKAATLRRPFWFSKYFITSSSKMIESWGIASVAGDPDHAHNFISINNVASFLVNAVGHPAATNKLFEIGGPEALSWRDVASLYGKLLNRRVCIFTTPAWVYKMGCELFRPFSPAASNQLGIIWILAENEIQVDHSAVADEFKVRLEKAEDFLKGCLAEAPTGRAQAGHQDVNQWLQLE